jgi:uncharacterized protein
MGLEETAGSDQAVKLDAPSPTPLAPDDRLAAIDILRGIALFGVMAINLVFEFRVSIFEQLLPPVQWGAPLDQAIANFLDAAISLKAFALFSLLFGIGLAIQFDRLATKPRAILLLRRLLALLAFGLIHLILIWNGDILTEYALAGLLVLPFLYAPRWLLAGTVLVLLAVFASSHFSRLLPIHDATSLAHHVLEARRVYATGSFAEILSFRIHEIAAIAPLHVWVFPRTLALFLLGILVWRMEIVQRASENRWALFGVAIVALILTMLVGKNLSTVTLALAYAAVIVGLVSLPWGARLLGWAAPLGRMAFTNYIAQSLIFGFVFYGYGLGLFGQLRVSTALAFGIAVYAAQVVFSRWWLDRYRFGPLEWLWRSLMYCHKQPMRVSMTRSPSNPTSV